MQGSSTRLPGVRTPVTGSAVFLQGSAAGLPGVRTPVTGSAVFLRGSAARLPGVRTSLPGSAQNSFTKNPNDIADLCRAQKK